jgi:hypothetical protein
VFGVIVVPRDAVTAQECEKLVSILLKSLSAFWPAPGSEYPELGVLMEPEVRHGAAEVYAGVQA